MAYIFLKISIWTHCWNRLWHVEPEPNSFGSIFHWHPVLRTCRIPSSTFLNGITGRPTVYLGFSYGNRSFLMSHSSSEILIMVNLFLFLLLWRLQLEIYWLIMLTSYISIEFWDRLLIKKPNLNGIIKAKMFMRILMWSLTLIHISSYLKQLSFKNRSCQVINTLRCSIKWL